MSAQDASEGLPPLWLAVGVILVVGAFAMVAIISATARQKREMDELFEAARQANREWHAALLAYLTAPPPAKKPTAKTPPEAITVELEVIKPADLRKGENERG